MFLIRTIACLALWWVVATGNGHAASLVERKPVAISLDAPPRVETRRSCVLRARDGAAMTILSVGATDPAIAVDLRENTEGRTYVVTATLPAGYRTPGDKPVDILVRTDLADEPVVRIPVRVWAGPLPHDPGWLSRARALIGGPAPEVAVDWLPGREPEMPPADCGITVLVFSAHWCWHCDRHVPVLEKVWQDYAGHGVQFLGVAAAGGNGQGIADAAERWGVDWPLGVDRSFRAVRGFGVVAYPVVFVIGPNGIVEAVHGRRSNAGVGNGLDDLDMELRTELDILLAGGNRADFPDWEKAAELAAAPPPAVSTRPAGPVLMVASEHRAASCKPGASTVFKVPIRNPGLEVLRLLKVSPAEGVTIDADNVKEVPAGGLAVLRCRVVAPVEPGAFSRRVKIESDAPGNPVAETALSGTVTAE